MHGTEAPGECEPAPWVWQDDLRERVYGYMLAAIGCGPFDGGCLAFAHALQRVHGGELWVIEARAQRPAGTLQAHHAVLALGGGRFADADGLHAGSAQALDWFLEREGYAFALTGADLRPIARGDLPDAPCPEALIEQLAVAIESVPVPVLRLNRAPRR